MSSDQPSHDLSALYKVIQQLRGPEGCPWDKKQSPESIKKYLLEETHELADAMSHKNYQHICEEIGDLYFILTLIIQIYEEENHFSINDVFNGIIKKMIRRHPHVFEGIKAGNEFELKQQWEAIKSAEKKNE